MRERNLLYLFLALNIGLAGAFVTYLFISNRQQPEVVAANFPSSPQTNADIRVAASTTARTNGSPTNVPVTVTIQESKPVVAAVTNQPVLTPVFTKKKVTWEQVESEDYLKYIDSLRGVGCPEEKVRYIILADINELFAKKRLKEAITHDTQWWHAEPEMMLVNVLQARGRELEDQRRDLVTKLLGPEALENEKGESLLWSTVQLSGPVLGSLSPELHNQVQEICARAKERNDSIVFARDTQGQPLSPVEHAKMREQTRAELKQMLNAEELEEFLLRYSQNALTLRNELRAIDPTPDEFRKIFRAIDPIDHQMQLQYGSKEAMSEKQKERYDRQRQEIIRESLGPQRFDTYLLAKDPLYLQAQMFARQYGAPKAVLPIYQMTKANESKRQKIIEDPALTPQQKSEAINAIYQEQQRSIQKMAGQIQ